MKIESTQDELSFSWNKRSKLIIVLITTSIIISLTAAYLVSKVADLSIEVNNHKAKIIELKRNNNELQDKVDDLESKSDEHQETIERIEEYLKEGNY